MLNIHRPDHSELFIDGQWQPATGGRTFPVLDPASGEAVAKVADATPADAQAAAAAAGETFADFAELTGVERGALLLRTRDLLAERLDVVARIITQEQGKPLAEAEGELEGCLEFLEWYAEEAKREYGLVLGGVTKSKRQLVLRQPVGPVALITPWNFPAMMIMRKAASALAAGCPVVAKPAEQTPLTAIALFEILDAAGFPPGAVNLVTTSRPETTGTALLDHPAIRHVPFTGSTSVGKQLAGAAGLRMQRISMELGGHAPWIVFHDADVDLALAHLLVTKFKNSGQTCVSPNRIFVHDDIADEFANRLAKAAAGIVLGSGLDSTTQMGPLIDESARTKVGEHVADATSRGATLLTGGEPVRRPGYFFAPTVLLDVDLDMRVSREETFGPVAPIRRFATEDEVVTAANGTPYGLIAYVYTRDLARAIRVSEALEFGVVGINDNRPGSVQTPFGGIKASGVGREGGRDGMEEFLESKTVSIGLP